MKFRIFYAPQVFKTWEKLFVLTEDGKLYSEYLMRFNLEKIQKSNINYENFRAKDFSWGKGVEGNSGIAYSNYQDCEKELSWEEYKNLKPSNLLSGYKINDINSQIRWVEKYLKLNDLDEQDWDNTFLKQ
jgi:hypothetical protein